MSAVAEQLRQARLARNLSVEQVAETTNIRSDYVRALEAGDFSFVTAPVYLRGFVRTYSTLLKLDVPQVMKALEVEMGQTKNLSEPPPLTESPRTFTDFLMYQLTQWGWRNTAIGLGALVMLFLALCGYLVYGRQKKADPLANLPPAMYRSTQSVSGETLPFPTNSPSGKK